MYDYVPPYSPRYHIPNVDADKSEEPTNYSWWNEKYKTQYSY